jgi:hypothetical protein
MIAMARARQAPPARLGAIAMTPGTIDVQAVRRHFTFPEHGRIATNNAARGAPSPLARPGCTLGVIVSDLGGECDADPLTVQLRVHCMLRPAGFWVSRSGAGVVRRPWRLACCEELALADCHIAGYSARSAVAVLVAAAQLAGSSAPATAIIRPARASTATCPLPYTRRKLAGRPVLAAAAMTGST